MEEFHDEINQLRITAQQLENVDINNFVNETEQIGLLMICSKKKFESIFIRNIQVNN
jgi:hypothetical protein